MKNTGDISKGLQSFQKEKIGVVTTDNPPIMDDADSQDALTMIADAAGSGGGGGPAECIEVRTADPTGADLYQGRIWVIQ